MPSAFTIEGTSGRSRRKKRRSDSRVLSEGDCKRVQHGRSKTMTIEVCRVRGKMKFQPGTTRHGR